MMQEHRRSWRIHGGSSVSVLRTWSGKAAVPGVAVKAVQFRFLPGGEDAESECIPPAQLLQLAADGGLDARGLAAAQRQDDIAVLVDPPR